MLSDGKITDEVIADSNGTNIVANQRKREIFNLFTEVQRTQKQLNENLI